MSEEKWTEVLEELENLGLQPRNPAAVGALARGDIGDFLTAATPGDIEAQEAAGQREFVANSTLPKECNYNTTREQLEQVGIVFGEDADDLFVNVQLPEGWSKVATGHPMWSRLIDDQGRERAAIFYKAAFYDRNAHISLSRRFSYGVQPLGGYEQEYDHETVARVCVVTDCDEIIWQSEPLSPSDTLKSYNLSRELEPLGKAWLEERYPNWKDPLAYW